MVVVVAEAADLAVAGISDGEGDSAPGATLVLNTSATVQTNVVGLQWQAVFMV
jgi:hypothetical protein